MALFSFSLSSWTYACLAARIFLLGIWAHLISFPEFEKASFPGRNRERGFVNAYAVKRHVSRQAERVNYAEISTCCLQNSFIILPQKGGVVKHYFCRLGKNQTPYFRVLTRTPGPMVVATVALLKYWPLAAAGL